MSPRLVALCLAVVVLLVPLRAGSVPGEASGDAWLAKAAFIRNIAMFVEWPVRSFRNPQSPIVATILGDGPETDAFRGIQGKKVRSRTIQVRMAADVADVGPTHILFVCPSQRQVLPHIMEAVKGKSILTVSDMEQFIKAGGMISFMTLNDKPVFDVNLGAARKAGLKFSSQMLKLARTVSD